MAGGDLWLRGGDLHRRPRPGRGAGAGTEESRDARREGIYIEDLRETFVRDYVFPMFRANALYEGVYLLGTSIARPLIAKRQIEIAHETGADAVCHGSTGKGNDQVRFESAFAALAPDLEVIAPWREWDLRSREDLLAYIAERDIPTTSSARSNSAQWAKFAAVASRTLLLWSMVDWNCGYKKSFLC